MVTTIAKFVNDTFSKMSLRRGQKMEARSFNKIKGRISRPSDPLREALKNSELRYRRLFETAQGGIVIIDAETGYIIDVNPFLVNPLGYAKSISAVTSVGALEEKNARMESNPNGVPTDIGRGAGKHSTAV